MEFEQTLTSKCLENVDVEKQIYVQYPDNYLGMQQIQIPKWEGQKVEILKAFLGQNPKGSYFGQILAILKYENRFLKVRFHVWKPFQTAALANHMAEIEELVPKVSMGYMYLNPIPTNFGTKACWLYTPDSQLDEESLALRSVSKALKAYSVNNQLCKKFRSQHKKESSRTQREGK